MVLFVVQFSPVCNFGKFISFGLGAVRSERANGCLCQLGDVVAQWLVRRTWDQKVESSSPGRCTHVLFLGKTLNSHSASLHLRVEMGTSKLLWGQSKKMLGGNL